MSKKLVNIILIISFLITPTFKTFGFSGVEVKDSSISATVIQVLSGDAIKVKLDSNNNIAYVKLKGITSNGFDQSYQYLANELLGEKVILVKDGTSFKGKWNYLNVLYNGRNINCELVLNGLAILDKTQDRGSLYTTLLRNEEIAKNSLVGIWKYNSNLYSSLNNESGLIKTNEKVNINTATKYQLENLLKGINSKLATNIIEYRRKNPFSEISEIKFVEGFTKEIFNQNRFSIVVMTNINTASEYELKTLNNLSENQVNSIVEKRNNSNFTNKYTLLENNILSNSEFNIIKDFIDTSSSTYISNRMPSSIINLNGSNKNYLTDVGLSFTKADEIISFRKNGYTLKTLFELNKFNKSNISIQDLNNLEDNINLITNLNSSNENEIFSLFGTSLGQKVYKTNFKTKEELKNIIGDKEYEKVKDMVSVGVTTPSYININTSSKEIMQENGLSSSEISSIINSRPINSPNDFTFNVSKINSKISLYTNINKASLKELMSLGLSSALVNQVLMYVENQPFGSLEELKNFFISFNELNLYEKIKSYIVFR